MAATLTSEPVNGMWPDRTFPLIVLLTIVLDGLALTGERAGLYGPEVAFILVATANLLIVAIVAWLSARTLNRVDAARRLIETSLRNGENRLRAIIHAVPECVTLMDARCTLIEMNPAGLAMAEADSASQVIGQNILPRLDERFRPAFDDLTRRVFQGESGTLDFEFIGLHGTRRWLIMQASPLRDADGRITAALAVTRDVTKQRQAEDEHLRLEHHVPHSQTLQALGTLAGGVAHDVNNLLTIIAGNGELAALSMPPDHPAHQHLNEIQKAGTRASDLVRRILRFSRPEHTDDQPANNMGVVDDAGRLRPTIFSTTIEIQTEIAPHLSTVAANTPTVATHPTRPDPAPGGGEHILLVDDEEDLVLLVTQLLERLGYRVTGFTNPVLALGAFQSDPSAYDLVVTDVSMPGMSGPDLARHILLMRPAMPVVMTSGYLQPDDEVAAQRLGVRKLILKPNTIYELGATIARLLNEGRRRTSARPST